MPSNEKKASPALAEQKRAYYLNEVRSHGRNYSNFDWPSVEVILNLLLVGDELQTHTAGRFARYGLSISAFNVLTILSRRKKEGCFPHELSELLLVTRANITGVIETLVKQGFVVRRLNESDRRKCRLQITPAGQNLLDRILPDHFKELKRVVCSLSSSEKKSFNHLMEKIRSGLVKERGGE